MRGKIAIFITLLLFSLSSFSIACEEAKVVIKVYAAKMEQKMIPFDEAYKIRNLLENIIKAKEFEKLPILFNEMNDLLNIDDLLNESIIEIKGVKNLIEKSDADFLLNMLCFIIGYGINSWIETSTSILSIFIYNLLEKLKLPLLQLIIYSIYFYSIFSPKIYLPIAGWIIAQKGEIHTFGLFGHKSISIDRMPALFILLRFVGLAITFIWRGYEETYVMGIALAIFGG